MCLVVFPCNFIVWSFPAILWCRDLLETYGREMFVVFIYVNFGLVCLLCTGLLIVVPIDGAEICCKSHTIVLLAKVVHPQPYKIAGEFQ